MWQTVKFGVFISAVRGGRWDLVRLRRVEGDVSGCICRSFFRVSQLGRFFASLEARIEGVGGLLRAYLEWVQDGQVTRTFRLVAWAWACVFRFWSGRD